MKKLLFLFVLSLNLAYVFSQNENRFLFVARMMETDAIDLKCDIVPYPEGNYDGSATWKNYQNSISNLINNNRYVISFVRTKFGLLILHKQNTKSIKQIHYSFTYTPDKTIDKMMKKGFCVGYYNMDSPGKVLFEKNPNVTKQEFVSKSWSDEKTNKLIKKMNSKGMYCVAITNITTKLLFQNGHDNIKEQIFATIPLSNFLNDVVQKVNEGWIVRHVYKDAERASIIYEKPKDGDTKRQTIGLIRDADYFSQFLEDRVAAGYNLDMIWGGIYTDMSDITYDNVVATNTNETTTTSIWDILGGLTTTVTGIIAGPNNVNTGTGFNTMPQTNSNDNSNSVNNQSSGSGRCSLCNGTGKCTPRSYSARKETCNGSGLCGYCNGAGWIWAGNARSVCTACDGSKKCKTCKGSGKCQQCHGTGKH